MPDLFRGPVVRNLSPDKIHVAENLKKLSEKVQTLVLWLDCDREGEAIAYEVIEIC